MPSWNDPNNTNPSHTNVLEDLGAKDTYALTMGQEDPGYTDLPTGTMKWDNNQKLLRRREGGTDQPAVLSLAGGGTGSTDAAGARTVLQVNKSGVADGEARTNAQNDLRYVKLVGGFDAIKEAATSTETGVVKLNNTLTSTATDAALTAAQGKVLKDSISTLQGKHLYTSVWSGSSTTVTDSMIKAASGGSTIGSGVFYLYTLTGGTERFYTVYKSLNSDSQTHTGTSRLSGNNIYVAEWGGGSKRFEVKNYSMSTNSYSTSETIIEIYKQSL